VYWLTSFLAELGHDHTPYEIVVGAYMFWSRLPWWIAAMRAATSKDPGKLEHAQKALRAIKPRRKRNHRRRMRR
jgi:hypothetical protein